jgi:hypothetical protein
MWACPICGSPDTSCGHHAGVRMMTRAEAASLALRLRLVDFKSRAAGGDE